MYHPESSAISSLVASYLLGCLLCTLSQIAVAGKGKNVFAFCLTQCLSFQFTSCAVLFK